VHTPEWFGPPRLWFLGPLSIGWSDEGVMKVRDGGDVPGVTGQGACEEAALVVDQMGNDHFDDPLGEPGCKRRGCRRNVVRSTRRTRPPDPIPNSLD
jgi:hypothetical protein